MLRAHVQHEFRRVEEGLVFGIEIEVVNHTGAALALLGVNVVALNQIFHCPLSMATLFRTQSWSCWRIA